MNTRFALFLASATSLFLELLLIRWISTEIPMLSYFKNFPLLAAFTGLGLGCLLAEGRRSLWSPSLIVFGVLMLVVCCADKLGLHEMVFPEANMDLWENIFDLAAERALWVMGRNLTVIFAILGACCFSFLGFGQAIGRLIKGGTPLRMYSVDILGSLTGTLLFALMAFLQTPPWLWLALLIVPCWALGRRLGVRQAGLGLAVVLIAVTAGLNFYRMERAAQFGRLVRWSPYYKIEVEPPQVEPTTQSRIFPLYVNRYIHQNMTDLSKSANPEVYPAETTLGQFLRLVSSEYNFPYFVKANPGSVLIAGAGTGNDVAAALRNGASQVTAVEIDPAILAVGKQVHPERPYDSPKVEMINNDIRSFLRRTDRKFDLIVYSILDSHTALSSLSSLRLDNYVYTAEGLRDAAAHLAPGGVVCLSFWENGRRWISQRIYRSIREGSGLTPISTDIGPVSCFIFGPQMDRAAIEARLVARGLQIHQDEMNSAIHAATDDWPFMYSNPKGEPWVYYFSLGLIVVLTGGLITWALRRGTPGLRLRLDWPMFFLGAGFLLVETKALAELSLLFGSTWVVNTFVFAGVFVMVLLANLAVAKGAGRNLGVVYALLLGSLLAWYFFPREALNALAFGPRALVGTGLVVLPLFFAGVIFARLFSRRTATNLAFGANLLGAVIGGAMEATSLVWGIRALTLLAIAFYVLSFLTRGQGETPGTTPQAGPGQGEAAEPAQAEAVTERREALPAN